MFESLLSKTRARKIHSLMVDLTYSQYSDFKKICAERGPFFEPWIKTPAKAFFDLMFLNYFAGYAACEHTTKGDKLYHATIEELHKLVLDEMGKPHPEFSISDDIVKGNFIVADIVKLSNDLELIRAEVEATTGQRIDPNNLRSNLRTIFLQVYERRFRDLFEYDVLVDGVSPFFPIALVLLGHFLGIAKQTGQSRKGIHAREFQFIQSTLENSYQRIKNELA